MSATPDHEPSRASADEPTPTASSIDPSHAIVEADPLLDERKLLGLPPTGLLSSGQIEAAMGLRAQDIRHHPMGESHKARRVLHLLEAAADRLQAQLALVGRGPLHPQAAKRVAARLAVTNRTAARLMVVSPEQRSASMGQVIARDLTDFDRLALAVLVVSRGWNATSAKRLASVADEHGVAVADLERVVDGLTRFLAEGGGVRGNIGDIGEGARLSMRSPRAMTRIDAAEDTVERVLHRLNDALRDEVTSESRASQARLALVFGLFALSWMGVLSWIFFSPSYESLSETPIVDNSTMPALTAEDAAVDASSTIDASSSAPLQRGANGELIAPVAARAAPAKFPRAPGFVPSVPPAGLLEAASAGADWVAAIEEVIPKLTTNGGHIDGLNLALVADALQRAGGAWCVSIGYRAEVTRAFVTLTKTLRSSDDFRKLMQAVPGSDVPIAGASANDAKIPQWQRTWIRAFGAGVLATVALDSSQPASASAAREEMRLRLIPIPSGVVPDPFASAATVQIAAAAPALAEQLALDTATLEDASRFVEAMNAAATTSALRTQAALAAVDACLRAPGALDKPGALVDFLGYMLHRLDFNSRGASSETVRNALASWMVDRSIPVTRLWVLTSLLDADMSIAWYGPDLVLATNADLPAREAMSEQMIAAFPKQQVTSIGEAVLVDGKTLEEWKLHVANADALPNDTACNRLRNAAVALGLARVARGFELGEPSVVKQALDDVIDLQSRKDSEWSASPTGERAGLPASGVGDGEFATVYATLGRDAAKRIDQIRALGARPAAGDLGPIDARVVVAEALRGTPSEVRVAAATVLVDRYPNGREVLQATLDALVDGGGSSDAAMFVSQLVGQSVAGRDWQSEARERLLDRLTLLEDSQLHADDSAGLEVARMANALTARFVRAAPTASGRPDRSLMQLADALRDEAASKFLAVSFPQSVDEIERLRGARRSLATSIAQRMAAETPGIVEYAAMLVAARQPALQSKLEPILSEGRRARTAAVSATEQVDVDLRTLLKVIAQGLAPRATERDAS